MHREFHVIHSHAGFALEVRDYRSWRWWLGGAVETAAGVVGHPCCGRGLGRSEHIGAAAYQVVVAAMNMQYSQSVQVARVPLSTEQALTIAPHHRDNIGPEGWITVDGVDEDGDVYEDARLIAARCADCGETIPAEGRSHARVLADHECPQVS